MLVVDSTVSGNCAIYSSPAAAISAPSSGATGTIKVATSSGCAWSASTDQPWVTFTQAAGSGSGTLAYTVEANYGPKRQATLRLGNYAFTVTQDGAAASAQAQAPALSSTSLNFDKRNVGATGSAQSVQLTNTGTTALALLAITAGGMNSSDFAETPMIAVRPCQPGNVVRSR